MASELHTQVSKEKVCNAKWHLSGQAGCCGIGTVSRLRANYPGRGTIDQHRREWENQAEPHLIQGMGTRPMEEKIRVMQRTPWPHKDVAAPMYCLPSTYFAATAVPVEIMFGACLEAMINRRNYGIWFLSDNMAESGDVHIGAFSTRYFVDWMVTENLCTMQTTGPIESRRTHDDIQGWMLTLNWNRCLDRIKRARADLTQLIKEFNSNEHVKGKGQAVRKDRATKRQRLAEQFSDGWAE